VLPELKSEDDMSEDELENEVFLEDEDEEDVDDADQADSED
jgi:hypothetical protein